MQDREKVFSFALLKKNVSNFLYTNCYIAAVALLALLFWVSGWVYAGVIIFAVIACYIFLSQRDITPVLPLVLSILFMPKDMTAFNSFGIFITFIPVAICLIAHFIIYPVKKFKFGKMFFPHLAVFLAFVLGGMFTDEISNYALGIVQILCVGLGTFFAYVVLNLYICPDDKRDFKSYFFSILLFVSLIPCIEGWYIKFIMNSTLGFHTFGWGNTGFIGYTILIAVPICYYFMVKYKHVLPYFLILGFEVASAILFKHDGAIGIICIMLPFITLFTYKHIRTEKRFAYCGLFYIGGLALVAGLSVYLLKEGDIFYTFFRHFINDTGRTPIYIEAIAKFLKFPIFGRGAYYPILYPATGDQVIYHSVFFHPLATMGIVGVLAYGYLIVSRFRILTKRANLFGYYAFLSALLFQIYASIDCGEFLIVVYFITILVTFAEKAIDMPDDLPILFFNRAGSKKDFL